MEDIRLEQFFTIVYSCTTDRQKPHERLVHEHALGCLLTGEMTFQSSKESFTIHEGDIVLVRKNQLARMEKKPSPRGEFQLISIFFTREFLQKYAVENKIIMEHKYTGKQNHLLTNDPFIGSFFNSLRAYLDHPVRNSEKLAELKVREAIELLIPLNPEYSKLLFDFNDPHKVDLRKYMNENYAFNVPIASFARLTGRSLASFKRDFQKEYGTSPRKWLQEKRLSEARYLIKEKGKRPGDIYLDLGFENLSHFYFSFKQRFGETPAELLVA